MILNDWFKLGRILRGLKCLSTKSVDEKKKKNCCLLKVCKLPCGRGVKKGDNWLLLAQWLATYICAYFKQNYFMLVKINRTNISTLNTTIKYVVFIRLFINCFKYCTCVVIIQFVIIKSFLLKTNIKPFYEH